VAGKLSEVIRRGKLHFQSWFRKLGNNL